jgi:putative DNA primase/helicase
VGEALKAKYPNAIFVYCADDDSAKEDTGLKYAQQAVAVSGGIVVLPQFNKVA